MRRKRRCNDAARWQRLENISASDARHWPALTSTDDTLPIYLNRISAARCPCRRRLFSAALWTTCWHI